MVVVLGLVAAANVLSAAISRRCCGKGRIMIHRRCESKSAWLLRVVIRVCIEQEGGFHVMTYCKALVYIMLECKRISTASKSSRVHATPVKNCRYFTLETNYHFLVSIAGLLRLMAGAMIYLVEAGCTTTGAACIEA